MTQTRSMTLETKVEDLTKNTNKNFEDLKISITTIKDEILNLKNIVIKNLLNENKKLKKKISKLERSNTNLTIAQNKLEQYGRRNNLEINGIPNEVKNKNLETKVCDVLKLVNGDVKSSDIEDCHRIGKKDPKTTIIRFTNRKFTKLALQNRKKLTSVDKSKVSIENEIYFNENLTPYNSKLSYLCRKLKRDIKSTGLIH